MDMSTRHIKITAKIKIMEVLNSTNEPMYAMDIGKKINMHVDEVCPNLYQMLHESPPRIGRFKVGSFYAYVSKEIMDIKKVPALTVSQEVLDAIFESIDQDEKNGVIGTHCKMLKVLRSELEARSMVNQPEE